MVSIKTDRTPPQTEKSVFINLKNIVVNSDMNFMAILDSYIKIIYHIIIIFSLRKTQLFDVTVKTWTIQFKVNIRRSVYHCASQFSTANSASNHHAVVLIDEKVIVIL